MSTRKINKNKLEREAISWLISNGLVRMFTLSCHDVFTVWLERERGGGVKGEKILNAYYSIIDLASRIIVQSTIVPGMNYGYYI